MTASWRFPSVKIWKLFGLFFVCFLTFYLSFHLKTLWAQTNLPANSAGTFQLVDDFESLTVGGLSGRNGWQASNGVSVIADPQDGANRVIQLPASGIDLEAYKALPTLLASSGTGTLHFRLRREGHLDGFAGASDEAAPNDWTSFEAQFGGQSNYAADQFVVRNGELFQPLANGFDAQNWYCIWLVVDNAADRYNAYAQGGVYTTPTLIGDSIRLRNSGTDPLRTFYTRLDDRTQSNLYLDDIYLDPSGQNLSTPGHACGAATPTVGFQRIDDFDALTTGTLNGRNGWQATDGVSIVTDPQGGTNQVVRLTQASTGDLAAYKALPMSLANSNMGTLHFRLRRDGHLDGFAGASDEAVPIDWTAFETQFGSQIGSAADQFVVRSGANFVTPSGGFGDRAWYCVWLVTNNQLDQYQAYVQGGTFTVPTALGSFNFRNGGSDPLGTFYARLDDGSASSLYLDDLYFDPDSENLAVPGNACGATSTPNDPPVANPDTYTTAQNTVLNGASVLSNDSDPNGQTLVVDTAPVASVSQGTLTLRADGSFTYSPNLNFTGQDSFVYRVCDVAVPSLCSQATATITVSPICYALTRLHQGAGSDPTASPGNSVNCPGGQYVAGEVINVNATPAQGGLIDRWIGTADDNSTAATNWLAMPAAPHTVQVVYRQATTNHPPTANNDAITVAQNSKNNSLNVLANDTTAPDTGETLTIVAVGQPNQNGQVTYSATNIIYTPAAGFVGEERFIYRIHDGNGGMAEATIIVTVAASASTVDLVAQSLEVTQAIQDLQNSIRLVAGKATYVRFHVRSAQNDYNTSAQLRVQKDGTEIVLRPVNPNGIATVRNAPNRTALHHAFLFQLPPAYTQGTVRLIATLNPDQNPAETNYQNNTVETTVPFEVAPPLNLVLYAIGYGNQIYPTTFDQDMLVEWLRQAYPLNTINVIRRSHYIGNNVPSCEQVNAELATKRSWDLQNRATPTGAHYYGMVADNGGLSFMRGCAAGIPAFVASGPTGSGNWGWDNDGSYGDWYGGHELGHVYQRYHAEFCGALGGSTYPYPDGRISPQLSGVTAIYGFNSKTQDIYDANWKDMMTYCANQWISDFTYEGLLSYFQTNTIGPSAIAAERTDRLLIVGTLNPVSRQVTLQPFFVIPDATEMGARVSGDYAIVLRAQNGLELARYPFTPLAMEHGPAAPFASRADEVVSLLISELVPYIAGTTRVDIEQLGTVLASVQAGAAAPTVSVLQPNGGETLDQETVTVAWSSQDPDGDPLAFTVQYSPDRGQTWTVIASDVQTNQVEVNTNNLVSSREGLFRVWASDDIHSGSDTTDATLLVPNHTPSVKIIQPAVDTTVVLSETLILAGQAYDIDDPNNSALELVWSSNIDGILGNGAQISTAALSKGNHTVTLYADDGAGGISSHSVKIFVVTPGSTGPANQLLVGPKTIVFNANATQQTTVISLDNRNDAAPMRWVATTDVNWLTLDATSGATPYDLTIALQSGALAPGVYSANITFVSPNLPGQSVTVQVSATVPETQEPTDEENTVFLPFVRK